jgi:signal transduction histidine kinase
MVAGVTMTTRSSGPGSSAGAGPGHLVLRHFFALLAPALALVAIFAVIVFGYLVPLIEQNHLDQTYDRCQRMVESAVSGLESDRIEGAVFGRPLFETQYRASERLRSLRFGEEDKDYYWILGPDGRFLMHPYRPDLEGQDPAVVAAPDGRPLAELVAEFQEAAGPDGDGMVAYSWNWKDDVGLLLDKVSYAVSYTHLTLPTTPYV